MLFQSDPRGKAVYKPFVWVGSNAGHMDDVFGLNDMGLCWVAFDQVRLIGGLTSDLGGATPVDCFGGFAHQSLPHWIVSRIAKARQSVCI